MLKSNAILSIGAQIIMLEHSSETDTWSMINCGGRLLANAK